MDTIKQLISLHIDAVTLRDSIGEKHTTVTSCEADEDVIMSKSIEERLLDVSKSAMKDFLESQDVVEDRKSSTAEYRGEIDRFDGIFDNQREEIMQRDKTIDKLEDIIAQHQSEKEILNDTIDEQANEIKLLKERIARRF